MGKTLTIGALSTLIAETEKYLEVLTENRTVIGKAADMCDQAMGSDEISKKYIDKLDNALPLLDKAITTAEEMIVAMKADREAALDVLLDN